MKMSFAIIIGGALFIFLAVVTVAVFMPNWIWSPPQTTAAHVYTDQQLLGRKLYFSNGCDYCHTQYVRYYDVDFTGPVSQGGNYVFDQPLTLGSERTGPDLSYIGRKRDMQWEVDHLKDPRKYSPMSIMPNWDFLSETDLEAIAAYLWDLGNREAGEYMIQPPVEYAHATNPVEIPQVTPDPQTNPQGWDTWTATNLQDGKIIFIDRCQVCHGCSGNGLGVYAGTKVITPADFKQEPFRSMPDDQWFWHVSEGIQGSVMPPWRETLTETQRWEVIRYIQQMFSQPIERDPDEGDPSGEYADLVNPLSQTVETFEIGKNIWSRECSLCHGNAGVNDGIYNQFLRPQPANFSDHEHYGTLGNTDYLDDDYYWRISEGLPWSAMPVWKVKYSEDERWALVYYIRVAFTQTLARPEATISQVYPDIYLAQIAPVDLTGNDLDVGDSSQLVYRAPDPELGKVIYTTYCAECHGFTGQADGWNAQYLVSKPANFTSSHTRGLGDGDWFARVSFGLQNTAMPDWGEWLTEQDRWDVISYVRKYLVNATTPGQVTFQPSIFTANGGNVNALYLSLSQANWTDEGGVLDPQHGQDLYDQYCSVCHGEKGTGIIPTDMSAGVGYPEPFAGNMPQSYVYQQIWSGVSNSTMPSFKPLLQPADVWDLVVYLVGQTQ
jgi:cytochrome c oxidase cbb3-type subunit II